MIARRPVMRDYAKEFEARAAFIRSLLEKSGARIAYTMKSGAVTVRTDGEKISAEENIS